jgi:uncharacterized protein DUF7010
MTIDELRAAVRRDQLGSFVRLKGGYTFPIAGAIYWAALGVAGYYLPVDRWILVAFIFSGTIFPLAWLLSTLLGVNFMKDKTATGDVLGPAFTGMLIFYPIAFAAYGHAPQLVSLILAIGMSQHWPVIGWGYGKPGLYSAHAVVRALGAVTIWAAMPDDRFTLIPFWVSAIYLATVAAILMDWRREARR